MIGSLLYILPAGGYSGGANSVVQEVSGFLAMGIHARIAVDEKNFASFSNAYASLPSVASNLHSYLGEASLSKLLAQYDNVVMTVATSVPAVISAWEKLSTESRPRLFYYIQDYEPLFFHKGTPEWHAARRSYEYPLIMQGFAKTDWICETVQRNHGLTVSRVKASIDHSVYFPLLNIKRTDTVIRVTAMIRPSTPRRAPRRTCRIMNRIADELGAQVSVHTFGCTVNELREAGLKLNAEVTHHGRLTREQVANLLRRTDLFLDLSDFQAFGRTGLEAMACGAVPIVTAFGGTNEYIVQGANGLATDVRYDEQILADVRAFCSLPESSRKSMYLNAINTAAKYSVTAACASILSVFLSG